MTVPPTESGERDPGPVTRIAEEFIRLREAGTLTDLDEFCGRYPKDQREQVREECEDLLRIRGIIKHRDGLTPGQTLASYKIVEQIGAGGMGKVYRARDSRLDRDIAIKVLPPELACQPERVKRFKREAKAIAALDHPNIVTIHSVEESDGLHFITMQLVLGKTLSEMIPEKGFVLEKGLALEKFFDLAIPLADAISSAHEQQIIHRDLKPANIMVTADGRVAILDFGLAKLKQPVTAERTTQMPVSSLTGEGQIVGTVAYMSPEQAEGRNVDHRTDIFSLGIILYEMLTGERPFKGQTRVALMSSIMKDTPTAVQEFGPQVPNHLGRIIRRSLEKDPERRFQTSKDLRNELENLAREIESSEVSELRKEELPLESWQRTIGEFLSVRNGIEAQCGGNSIVHLRKAWEIRGLDPEMAVFRALTAEEEAVTSLFHAVKQVGYENADRLKPRNHVHKCAVAPFFSAIVRFMNRSRIAALEPTLHFRVAEKRVGTRLTFRQLPPEMRYVFPDPPLGFRIRSHREGELEQPDFKSEFAEIASAKNAASMLDHVREDANRRRGVLYASAGGMPEVSDPPKPFLLHQRTLVFNILAAVLLIAPYKRQSFVQQALDAFLGMLDHLPADLESEADG